MPDVASNYTASVCLMLSLLLGSLFLLASLVLSAFLLLLSSLLFCISAVAVVPAVDGVFAVASFRAEAGAPIAGIFTHCTVLYKSDIYRPTDYRTKAIGLSFFSAIELLSDYRISYLLKAIGCPPLNVTLKPLQRPIKYIIQYNIHNNANRFFLDSHWLEIRKKTLLSLYETELRKPGKFR